SGSGTVAVQVTAMGNVISNTVTALISGSTVTAAGDITVTAQDIAPSVIPTWMVPANTQSTINSDLSGSPIDPTANILALMVSVAGSGTVAVNGAISGNVISNTIEADIIDSSTVQSTGGKLDLEADSKAGIIAVTVGVAGSGAVAVNATGFGNVIANTIDASIRDGSRVTTSSLVKQNATDQSDIRSLGISVAGTGAVAAGALIGANVISNTVSAEISGSTVMSGSTLDLSAQEESTILGFTTGVAASGAGAGLLSLTANVITNTTEAGIVDETIGQTDTHSTVQAAGSVTISAQDTSSIEAIAIGVSGTGGGAIGLAVAGNVIANKIQTFITGSTLSSTNSTISMSSVSSAVIRSLAIGVS